MPSCGAVQRCGRYVTAHVVTCGASQGSDAEVPLTVRKAALSGIWFLGSARSLVPTRACSEKEPRRRASAAAAVLCWDCCLSSCYSSRGPGCGQLPARRGMRLGERLRASLSGTLGSAPRRARSVRSRRGTVSRPDSRLSDDVLFLCEGDDELHSLTRSGSSTSSLAEAGAGSDGAKVGRPRQEHVRGVRDLPNSRPRSEVRRRREERIFLLHGVSSRSLVDIVTIFGTKIIARKFGIRFGLSM